MRTFIALLHVIRMRGAVWRAVNQPRGSMRSTRRPLVRLAADAPTESGLTLIEVVISALLVGIIAIATISGFVSAGHATTNARNRDQATLIAAQDQERLRGLALTKLTQFGAKKYEVSETGLSCEEHATACETGNTYTVESSAQYVSAEYKEGTKTEDTLTCSTSEGEANFIKSTSVVHWTEAGKEKHLEQSSILSVPTSSALEVRVLDQAKQPISGATVTAKGTTTNASQTTNATGCVVFGSINDKTVEVAASRNGFVSHEGGSPAEKSATPSSKALASQELALAEPGAVEARFTTNGSTTGASWETAYVAQAGVGSPPNFVASAGKPATSVTMSGLFPFVAPNTYTVYAGDCEKNNPETVAGSGVKAAAAQIEPNQTTPVTVEVPKVNLAVKSGTSSVPGTTVTSSSAKLINTECASKSAQNYTTTVPYEHPIKVVNGVLEPAYAPYAKSLKLCLVFAESGKYYKSEYTFANSAKAGTTAATFYAKTSGSYTTVTSSTTC